MNDAERKLMLATYRGWVSRLWYCSNALEKAKKDLAEADQNVKSFCDLLEKLEPGLLRKEADRAKQLKKLPLNIK